MDYWRAAMRAASCRSTDLKFPCKILGLNIQNAEDFAQFLLKGFILFTYRTGFTSLPHSEVTSDKGWGCLARSSQMLLARALYQHRAECCRIEYFCDEIEAPFSLHKMVQATTRGSVFRPEYWTPSQGCQAIRQCLSDAVKQEYVSPPLSVVMSCNGSISECDVLEALRDVGAVLILSPIRCGAWRCLTQRVFMALENLMDTELSVGIVGGSPGRCYYIIGCDNLNLFYLDPHCRTQNAFLSRNLDEAGIVGATPSLVHALHHGSVDSSLFMGFLLDSVHKWEELKKKIVDLKDLQMPELLCVVDRHITELPDVKVEEWTLSEDAEG